MFITLLALPIFLFLFAQPVQAYLDPGTGSFITQVIIGFLVGGTYMLKVYWKKVRDFIQSLFSRSQNNEEAQKN